MDGVGLVPVILRTSTGLEELGRTAFLQLVASVNAELVLQASSWGSWDVAFASVMDMEYEPTLLEPFEGQHMYLGHIPTLIDAPVTSYPNLSVMATDLAPAPSSMDQHDEYLMNFFVEFMVKCDEATGSDNQQRQVNKRVQRTASAIHNVLMQDPTLGGFVSDTIMTRSINITDAFIRREQHARGTEWFWQAGRMDYTARVPAVYR